MTESISLATLRKPAGQAKFRVVAVNSFGEIIIQDFASLENQSLHGATIYGAACLQQQYQNAAIYNKSGELIQGWLTLPGCFIRNPQCILHWGFSLF